VLATVEQYRTAMRDFAGMATLAVWYAQLEIESLLQPTSDIFLGWVSAPSRTARSATST